MREGSQMVMPSFRLLHAGRCEGGGGGGVQECDTQLQWVTKAARAGGRAGGPPSREHKCGRQLHTMHTFARILCSVL